MFLHLGNDFVINENDIIAILNLDSISTSKHTQAYLKNIEKEKLVTSICDDIPRTLIVTENNSKHNVYLSNISSTTLYKRAKKI